MRIHQLAAAVVLSIAAEASAASAPRIEDDYPRALAEARQRGVPILVEAWAPW